MTNILDNIKLAIIISEFNKEITDQLLYGVLKRLRDHTIPSEQIAIFSVPGAVEIPLIAQLAAKTKQYQGIICLGAVIRGETSHYDYVCQQVSQGCQRVMLDFDIPVIFGVLTTENIEQAEERIGGKMGHKGEEAADAAIAMINLVKQLKI